MSLTPLDELMPTGAMMGQIMVTTRINRLEAEGERKLRQAANFTGRSVQLSQEDIQLEGISSLAYAFTEALKLTPEAVASAKRRELAAKLADAYREIGREDAALEYEQYAERQSSFQLTSIGQTRFSRRRVNPLR